MNKDDHKLTIETYDRSAKQLADHFQNYAVGVMSEVIQKAFDLLGNPEGARVVEIGCGGGKDAGEIVGHASWYEGFDPSGELIKIAKENVPGAKFVQTDALSYEWPGKLNAVFAFASMLHLDRNDFQAVCSKVEAALVSGGVLCLSLKEADSYKSLLQEDKFGKRMFYLYSPDEVRQLAGPGFQTVYETHQTVGQQKKPFFTLILQKL